MNQILIQIMRLFVFILVQGLIFGQLNFDFGIHLMIYPLFILLLPFNISTTLLMLLSFVLGIGVDYFMNTFGLHASAAVMMAYIRPIIYQQFAPREGYDLLKSPTINDMGMAWFLKTSSVLLCIHHSWFFFLEYFKWSAWQEILTSTVLSSLIGLFIFILFQFIFFKKSKNT